MNYNSGVSLFVFKKNTGAQQSLKHWILEKCHTCDITAQKIVFRR